jgi:hypothetical protein
MWLVARDISQRAEPDVRSLGPAVSAFIAERTRRLSTLLTSDVPPQHLMRPVHSAGRRSQGHPADGAPMKGKCALGPFLSILVIECQHKWTYVNLCKVMDKVQIK